MRAPFVATHKAEKPKEPQEQQEQEGVVVVVTVSEEPLSAVKEQALKKTRRNRIIWLSVELFLLLALLALLVLHSFRLNRNKSDNTYAVWSSSWVMILLSIVLVIVAFAVFITFYYYKTTLTWIRDPATTDGAVLNPRSREVNKVRWSVFRSGAQQSGEQGHELQQRPWVSRQGRNSRAWRQMRAQQHRRQMMRDSSLSSTMTASSFSRGGGGPRRPPPAWRRQGP
ncbi:hypothetical protein GQ54DRAFT_1532 [Martensiomyces pterosporus]|nr:hypothetical protein GQ54DRAFT_1532 [Martensiomyces pterosporus]